MGTRQRLALRTVDLARAAGTHPNTVRVYLEHGYLPPVRRSPTGYRLFEPRHLDHMRIARLLLLDRWPGRAIRRSAKAVLVEAASRGLAGSVPAFEAHLALVRRERAVAGQACEVARGWLLGHPGPTPATGASLASADPPAAGVPPAGLRSGAAARRLHLTYDALRSWERSGLLRVPRDPTTGQRRFGPADLDRLVVIRTLRQAGYSPMAVLRMLTAADAGESERAVGILVGPDRDEDLVTASDRWAATLTEHERCACQALELAVAIPDDPVNPP